MNIETTLIYDKTSGVNRYSGHSFETKDVRDYLSNRVKQRYFDVEGMNEAIDEFNSVAETGFEVEVFHDIATRRRSVIDWKVGETLAECYLEDKCRVRFYYNAIRDLRNPDSNPAGADLVGFVEIDQNETLFLFGEVKTSDDKNHPPNVVYGRTGMTYQLEKLKNDSNERSNHIQWMMHKAKVLDERNPFKKDFKKALRLYLKSGCTKVKLTGVLIRDTDPHEKDLSSRYEALLKDLHDNMQLELLALYVPVPISDFTILCSGGEENDN